ncbi:MAG TPA: GNAT family N-acetyltransferase [Mycobacteriales bacterium]|nr:GNAT family N-acetyltransferase [Mycobacteriales bacterium]
MTDFPTLRPIEASEFPAYFKSLVETFGNDVRDSERESDRTVFEFDRSLAAFDGDRVVATSALFSRQITVPGGEVPFGAVTMVTVSPTHRRRGILTAMMRRLLTDIHDAGREPIAALWASEATIYGRFGYGVAARNLGLTGETHRLNVRPGLGATGQMRLVTPEEARPDLVRIYEAARPAEVGWLDRPSVWWDYLLYDAEDSREGATALRFAVHDGTDGTPDGYVVYRLRTVDGARQVDVHDLAATNPEATAALWRFLTELDLVGRIKKWHLAADDALQHLLVDRRGAELRANDGLWVRLVDVDRALSSRTYSGEIDVVLEVEDTFCPWNAGRWRLTGGPDGAKCVATADEPDLSLDAAALGAVYLGGTRLTELAAASQVRELRDGALIAASRAFLGDREPWCPEGF